MTWPRASPASTRVTNGPTKTWRTSRGLPGLTSTSNWGMKMPKPGDVVIFDFPGATGVKRRPAVVLSSDLYHAHRPDIILGIITSNTTAATTPTDCMLHDWAAAGLRAPSA